MPSFEQFVLRYLDTGEIAGTRIGSQAEFLKVSDRLAVDHLFAYERIGAFVDFLEDRLGFAVTLPKLLVSPKADLALSEPLRLRLRSHFAEDYALYASLTSKPLALS